MAERPAPPLLAPDPPPDVLAEGAEFEGLLALGRAARIGGRVRGEILSAGLVWIGEAARIAARIEAGAVVIEGRVEGDVSARERIELRSSARVRGDLCAPRLSLAEGSVLEGSCAMGEPGAPNP